MEEGQQQQESIQSCICTIPAARKEQGSGWAARDAVPDVPDRIMGLLCAGWGHVEAADVHNSRFFVPRALLVSAFSCFWSRGVGWGCWSPSVLPSTAQLTWALCRGRGNARVVSSWISELRAGIPAPFSTSRGRREGSAAGLVPPYLGNASVESKRTHQTKEPLQGIGDFFYQHCQAQEPEDKDDEEACGADKLGGP